MAASILLSSYYLLRGVVGGFRTDPEIVPLSNLEALPSISLGGASAWPIPKAMPRFMSQVFSGADPSRRIVVLFACLDLECWPV